MRDHKDITDYASLPTYKLPGKARKMTADECIAKAEECEARVEMWVTVRDRAHERKQAAGWRRLAAERA